ncbi:hypothetical protein Zm00014a_012623 [Zea mays]|uniref:Transducin/WD40 repeat-like superfamily protein n=1 Tax=Zea mays TaxID=4577 RepID=A0A3L6EG25_MAIZE|nr:hypothetical protein Zm00014a_012623 [Zea mays]
MPELAVLALSHALFHVAPLLPLSLPVFTVALSRISLAFFILLMDGESKLLASGGEDCTIRLWSMSTRAKNHPLIATFHGHEKALSFLSVAWHKSSLLVSCSKDSKEKEIILSMIISSILFDWLYLMVSVKVWDTVAPSSGSSPCVGSAHLNSNGPPIAMKCHESLCYIAAGAEVIAIDLRTMKKAFVLALQNHIILSCDIFYDAQNDFLTPEWDSENLQVVPSVIQTITNPF